MKNLWKAIRRFWSMTGGDTYTGGLVQGGNWRCIYPNGEKTRWLSYGDAANMRDNFGGKLEWREDVKEPQP